ncbi:PIN-like domain-containing protein [Bacillus subtilis]|uniref:PIN-like domain-containing protein n=1 Tax=Bacillus subtilis TaxID=1423 RepID=UPI00345B63C8
MLDNLKGLTGYEESEFKEIWENAIFVVDTNVLLNFYKYTSKEATQSLLRILKSLKESDRLWVPYQVALEYFFNYESNMYKQKEGYLFLGEGLHKLKVEADKTLKRTQSDYPYINTNEFKFYIEQLAKLNNKLDQILKAELDKLPDTSEIKDDIKKLLEGIIGEPYDQTKIDRIESEGNDRYKHDIPPGFKDKGNKKKEGYRIYGNFRYQKIYGDLILWNQMIDKVMDSDNPKPMIFITEEKKEDWWEKDEKDNIKRPHPLLVQEFINKTNQKFFMYRTERFVQYAKKYLNINITEEQVENVTKDVETIRTLEQKDDFNDSNEYSKLIDPSIYIKNFFSSSSRRKQLVDFLPEEKVDEFYDRLDKTTNMEELYIWCLKQSRKNISKRVKVLLDRLSYYDPEEANLYYERLKPFIDKKPILPYMKLLRYIEILEEKLSEIQFTK